MAGIETAISLMEDVFFRTSFNSQTWIMHLVIIIATMAIITRKAGDWKVLALPVMVGWGYFGMSLNWMFYAIGAIVFVVDILSIRAIESAIGAVSESFTKEKYMKGERAIRRDIKRMNVKGEFEKLQKEREDLILARTNPELLERKRLAKALKEESTREAIKQLKVERNKKKLQGMMEEEEKSTKIRSDL